MIAVRIFAAVALLSLMAHYPLMAIYPRMSAAPAWAVAIIAFNSAVMALAALCAAFILLLAIFRAPDRSLEGGDPEEGLRSREPDKAPNPTSATSNAPDDPE